MGSVAFWMDFENKSDGLTTSRERRRGVKDDFRV